MADGGFAGGAASGFGQGFGAMMQLGQIKAAREATAAKSALDAKKFEVDYWDKIGPRWEEATQITDPELKNLTFKALMGDAEAKLGKKAPPLLVEFLKRDPDQVQRDLTAMREEGMSFGDIALIGRDPSMAAAGLTALAKRLRTREAAAAVGGAGDTPSPSTAVQAAPGLAAAAELLRGRIEQMRANLKIAVDRGAPARSVSGLQTSIDAMEKDLATMTTGFQLGEAEQARRPITGVPENIARETGIVPGVTTLGEAQQLTRPGAPAAPTAGGTAPVAPTPAARVKLETPQEKFVRERDTKTIADVYGPEVAREAAQKGLTLVGEMNRAIAERRFRPLTAEEQARERKRAEGVLKTGFEDFDAIVSAGRLARSNRQMIETLAGIAPHLGGTGPFVTPVKQSLLNVAQVLGIANPGSLGEMELVSSLNLKLATNITAQMKGHQSDREFMAAILASPGILNSRQGLALMVHVGREANNLALWQEQQARLWQKNYGSLDSSRPDGMGFAEAIDRSLDMFYKENGTIAERVSRAAKLDPNALLRGELKAAR